MSLLCFSDKGWVVSHYDYTKNIYKNVLSQSGKIDLAYNKDLFNIITPLMKDQEALHIVENFLDESEFISIEHLRKNRKRNWEETLSKSQKDLLLEAEIVEDLYKKLMELAKSRQHFTYLLRRNDFLSNNEVARNAAKIFNSCNDQDFIRSQGTNSNSEPIIISFKNRSYVLPPLSTFIYCDIRTVQNVIEQKFDFILLDPPWWNRFVRRRKHKNDKNSYNMLNNDVIANISVDSLLRSDGLVAIWCTNGPSVIEFVLGNLLKQWKLNFVATWFWIKITQTGDPICPFRNNNGKKPYERLIFGARSDRTCKNPESNKCIVSIPSAIHSHKPPIIEILKDYIPEDAKCLELFARYLLPGWTSVGNEVLSLQACQLFEECVE